MDFIVAQALDPDVARLGWGGERHQHGEQRGEQADPVGEVLLHGRREQDVAETHAREGDERAERQGRAGGLDPDEEVEDEDGREEEARDQSRGDDDVLLPRPSSTRLVDASGEVP